MAKRVYRFYLVLLLLLTFKLVGYGQLPYPKWVNDMGGSGDSKPTGMVIDNQSDIYISGYFSGTVDFDPSAGTKNLTSSGNFDIYVAKYSSAGALIWAESMGGNGLDQVNYMCVDVNGNVTITGQQSSNTFDANPGAGVAAFTNQGIEDVFVIHLDTNGGFLWAKQIASNNVDRGEEVNADQQGNVIVTAIFSAPITLGANNYNPSGNFNGLIVKYSQTGNLLWSIDLGKTNAVEIYGNAVDSQNNIIVSGTFNATVDFNPLGIVHNLTANTSSAPFIAKYTPAGQLLWVYQYTGSLTNNNSFINVDNNDNIRLSGAFNGQLKFGGTTTITGAGSSNIFIAKFLPDGSLQWAKAMNGSGSSYAFAYQMQTDQDGNTYLAGYFTGTIDFNPDPAAVANITYHGQRDFFLAKFDLDGNYKWAFSGGSPNCDLTMGIELAINSARDLFLAGSFCNTVDFDPSSCNILNVTAKNFTSDSFIADYSQYTPTSVLSKITSFNIPQQTGPAVIDQTLATIKITVPLGTDVTNLTPVITVDNGGVLTPASGFAKNFTNPVNYVVSTSCSALTYTVTVTTQPTTPVTICPADATALTGEAPAITPNSYLWQVNQNNTWTTAAGTANGKDYAINGNQFANTTGAAIIYNLRRQNTTGNAVSYDSFYSLTVNPSTQGNTVNADVGQVCAGQTSPINFTGNQPAGYTASAVFTWQQSPDNINWTNINGANQQNYQCNSALTQATWFRRVTILGTCPDYSNSITVDFLPAVTTSVAGADQPLCNQSLTTLTANAPANGETGTWTVLSPVGYNPFNAANVNDPKAVINNLPANVNVQLQWTILKTACGQQSQSTVNVINADKGRVTGFALNEQTAPAVINQANQTISINVFYGTDVTQLIPQVTTNTGTLFPASDTPQNFSSPVTYTVTSQCGTVSYKAIVTIHTPPAQITSCQANPFMLAGDNPAGTVDGYEWQQNNNGIWAAASGTANKANYQSAGLANAGSSALTYSFRRKISSSGNVMYDSFYDVTINPAITNTVQADRSLICASNAQAINLSGNTPSTTTYPGVVYRWELSTDAQTWAAIANSNSATYQYTAPINQKTYFRRVIAQNTCEFYSNNVQIDYSGPVTSSNAGQAQSVCNQNSVTLSANAVAPGETGTWSVVSPVTYQPFSSSTVNDPNAVITNLPTDIDVQLKWTINNTVCGQQSASMITVRYNSLPLVDAGDDISVLYNKNTKLNGKITSAGNYTFKWVPAEGLSNPLVLDPIAAPTETTTYKLMVTSSAGCVVDDGVKVTVNKILTISDIFTPNGDGINDSWYVSGLDAYKSTEVFIFTRWGRQMYYSKGYPIPWDGTYQGQKLPAGVYYYLITIKDISLKKTGIITILY